MEMSKRTITEIIQQWRTPLKKRNEQQTRSELLKLIENSPNSLEAKVAVSPYAKILASPLRKCTFHNRFFSSKLLLRFGQAWHEPTKLIWAYPTFDKSSGKGVYVNLSKKVLEIFGKGGYKAAFRGQVAYRSDMIEHVENRLAQESLKEFKKQPIDTYHILSNTSSSQSSTWKANDSSASMGYQCILLFDPNTKSNLCESEHQIQNSGTTHNNIPCYKVHQIWSKEEIESILSELPPSENNMVALGVPKTLETVDLAIALWRQKKFLSS